MQRLVLALLLVATTAGCLNQSEVLPGSNESVTVFHGGTIWTAASQPFVEAVAVAQGRVIDTGTFNELNVRHPGAIRINLDGRMMMPGFHDTHNHLLDLVVAGGFTGQSSDPSSAGPTTFDPVVGTANQQIIAAAHACHWGVQHGEDSGESLLGHLPPDEATVIGDNLARETCYQGAANERPTGDELRNALRSVEDVALSFGITSSVQAGFEWDDYQSLAELADDSQLRWLVYLWPEGLTRTDVQTGHGPEMMQILGVKIYSDGWLGPRTAALHENYGDRPHNGFQFYEQPQMDDIVQTARNQGLKVTAHAIGDRAVDAVLDAYAAAEETGCSGGPTCGDPRYSIEHASVVSGGALDRLVDLAVIPSVQLSFPTSDAHWIDQAIGEGGGIPYPWRTLTDRGVILAGSSDWPIEVLPPLWGIERAVTRQEVDESLPAAWQASEGVDLDTALRMVTINAAILEFKDDELGSLEPGKRADFVVLSEDLFAIDAHFIADVEVLETWLDGERLFAA